MQVIGFGGGCHWCTEAVFQTLKGVLAVRQGFVTSDPPDDGWSEAVEIDFDATVVSLEDLLGVHLATHASTSNHKMRGKYRSAVYVPDPDTGVQAQALLQQFSEAAGTQFVTRILQNRGFKPSNVRFHDYYASDPSRPFCQTYIDPKLAKLRARFSRLLKQNGAAE